MRGGFIGTSTRALTGHDGRRGVVSLATLVGLELSLIQLDVCVLSDSSLTWTGLSLCVVGESNSSGPGSPFSVPIRMCVCVYGRRL